MRRPSVLFLLLCAMGAPALAEEAPRTVQAFEETIDVQAVNFEAVVTDSRGRRVTGLTAEDFKLFIDGIETPITFFSPVDVPGHASGSEPSAQPSWQSRHILVFLDESTMLKARRNLVLRSLIRQIEDLSTEDQMAVVAFSGSKLEVLCDWTADRQRLASVLTAVRKRRSDGIFVDVMRRQEMSDASLVDTAGARQPSTFQPSQLFNPLDRYLGIAEAAAGAMRGLPAPVAGRKMLMLLTEGFQDPVFAQPVIREAQRLGYSLYPVDVRGLDTSMAQNDASMGSPQAFRWISTPLDLNMNYTMAYMAEATGGKAAINSNRMVALERLVEDSSSYYVLGFSPTWRGDDRRHGIHLTVARPGLKVRARDSYVDSSRRTRLGLAADASLLFGRSRQEQRLIVNVEDAAPTAKGRKLAITLGVPVEALAFAPRENGFHAEAPFALVVLDDRGERKHMQESWVSVDVEELPREGTFARFRFSVDVGKRSQRVAITVHDALSGEALWGEALLETQEQARKSR